jgi:hypothetical protein
MGYVETGIESLDGFFFDPETARMLKNVDPPLKSDKGMRSFLKLIDGTLNWWKSMVTVVRPGFHLRNTYSNHFLGWVRHGLGYFNKNVHTTAMKATLYELYPADSPIWKFFQRTMGKSWTAEKIGKELAEKTWQGESILSIIARTRREGLIRSGVRVTDTSMIKGLKGVSKSSKRLAQRLNLAGRKSIVAEFGEGFGGIIESEARFASMLLEMKRYGDASIAAKITQEVFVDYENLTTFEREIGRRVLPFYSWLKQNTVNQVKFIFTQPGRYSKIPMVARALEKGAAYKIPEEWKPEYYQDLWMWQLPVTMPDGRVLFFNPNFPFQDLNKLNPFNFRKNIISAITPLLKIPLEQIAEQDMYRGMPIEKYPGYKAPVPGILQTFAKVLPRGMREKLGIEMDSQGRYVADPYITHLISNMAPFIDNMGRVLMQEPSKDKFFNWLSFSLGIKLKPQHPLDLQYYATREALRKRREELRRAGQ